MALEEIWKSQKLMFVQYDGTNGQEFFDYFSEYFPGATLTSDVDGVLLWQNGFVPRQVNTGDVYSRDCGFVSADVWETNWWPTEPMETLVAQPAHQCIMATGEANVPSLLLGATSAWITLTLDRDMGGVDYSISARCAAVTVVSALKVVQAEILTATTVRVKVQNTGLVALSGVVMVWAVK